MVLLRSSSAGEAQEGGSAQQPAALPGGFSLEAEVQEQVEKNRVKARGYVDIRAGEVRLQADTVEFWNEEMRVVAEGNVVFEQGGQKIVATKAIMDLQKRTGRFFNAYGNAEDFFFYGDVIEKESEEVYVIEGGAFTSCAQPSPRWTFTAGKARVRLDHNVRLHNAFLKVKSVPVFYLPFVYFPINKEDRSTGFLLPRIGTSTFKGFLVSDAFFWAISRSMDATFSVDHFSRSGTGYGTEYRYVLSPTSRGSFLTYFIQDKITQQRQYQLNYSLNQDLPWRFKAIGRVDYFSTFDFQQRFQENLNDATRRSKRATVNLSRAWSVYNFRILFDRNETSFGEQISLRQVLPQAQLSSRPARLFGTPLLFNFQTEAGRLNRPQRGQPLEYSRFDVAPTLSYPFTRLSWFTFRTSLGGRYTRYTKRLDRRGFPLDESVDRRYYDVTVDARGPTFSRIFDTPGNFYAERYKHVIEPQIVYGYRSRIEFFDKLPKFDGNDYIPGTNQLSFSLVNRFFGKRAAAPGATAAPVEFLTWTLSQRYFFDINASLYDAQFSTPYFSPDGTPSSYSPVSSRLHFRPGRTLNAVWDMEYDLNFGLMRLNSLLGNFSGDWGSADVGWTRRALNEDDVRNHLRGVAQVRLGERIETRFETSYDLSERDLQHFRAGLTYSIQCCGFIFEYTRFNFGAFRNETIYRFGVILANFGTFGYTLGGSSRLQ
jgi:LPS-assembly protein